METIEKKVSHTPGPWVLHYNEDGAPELGGGLNKYTTVWSEAGFGSIADVAYKKTNILGDSKVLQQKTFEANAKLIAAAPEMLEALKWAYDAFKRLSEDGKYPEFLLAENGGDGVMPIVNAIRKATK